MNKVRHKAKDAKTILGPTGTLRRVAAFAVVSKGYVGEDDWIVETLDSHDNGNFYVTVFAGPLAKERAIEYAEEKYSGIELRD